MSTAPTISPADREDEFAFGRSAIHDPLAENDAGEFGAAGYRADDEAAGNAPVDQHASRLAVEPRPEGQSRSWADLDWPVVLWIGGVHLAALAAPFFFSWSGLAICLVLYWVTGSLGVCLGPTTANITPSAIKKAILIPLATAGSGPTCSGCFQRMTRRNWRPT